MTDLMTELTEKKSENGKFKFNNQKVMFTFKTHIDKQGFKIFVESKTKLKLKKYYCAHECGTDDPITPYEHSHVVIDFGKAFQTTVARFFDFMDIHPHIGVINNNQKSNWKKACKYITKEDKSVILAPEDSFDAASSIWAHNNVQDALSDCGDLKNALATIAVFNCKKAEWGREIPCAISNVDEMRPFQRSLFNMVMKEPDDRKVVWIADKKGCQGKTQWLKYMNINHEGKVMWIVPSGKGSDIMHVFNEHLKAGWRGDTIIINLAKSASENSDCNQIYPLIESFKDGLIFSTKYMGGNMMIPPMHVVVLSNLMPNTSKLVEDRWSIYSIKDRELSPVTLKKGEIQIKESDDS